MKQYRVESLWAGFWGGFGSEGHIASRLNALAADDWRLVDSRSHMCTWWWIIPRPKILLIMEKDGAA